MNRLSCAGLISTMCLVVACSRVTPAPASDRASQTEAIERADGSSDESLNRTLDRMRAGMTIQEIADFTDALVRVGSRTSVAALREHPGDVEAMNKALREAVHGKSVAEILVAGAPP